ncbi:hypothetical protein ACOSP7_012558 [Xanthoceras sorbifolium]
MSNKLASHVQETRQSIKNLENQIGQLATAFRQKDSEELPSQEILSDYSLMEIEVDNVTTCDNDLQLATLTREDNFFRTPSAELHQESMLTPVSSMKDITSLKIEVVHMLEATPLLKPPKVELKPLHKTLQYAYLGEGETLPPITIEKLSKTKEEELGRKLRKSSFKINEQQMRPYLDDDPSTKGETLPLVTTQS